MTFNLQVKTHYDVIVIGGGVNGAGIAADAAGRGLSVLLVEAKDLASATSSNSSKLIHGGLRYLEQYDFGLVRDALAEREVLLQNAPHIMWPLRFRLPHQKHLRPQWMIQIGMFLYDNLAKRVTLPKSRKVKMDANSPLHSHLTTCFEYSDGWVDDSRLVVLNAMQAAQHNADVLTYTYCAKAKKNKASWDITLQDRHGNTIDVSTRALVNATGPWATRFLNEQVNHDKHQSMRLVKGSHIVVPKIHDQDEAYILQNEDGRIVFVLPYEDEFSLLGTTDVDYQGDARDAAISDAETQYILDVVKAHFTTNVSADDVVHTFSGVRPLLEEEGSDAQSLSRDYTLTLEGSDDEAVLLNIFGGKITTYRSLSEKAVDKLEPFFTHMTSAWTDKTPLPGGDFTSPTVLLEKLQSEFSFVEPPILSRMVRSYGSLTHQILSECTTSLDLGVHFGAGLFAVEVDYLLQNEWTVTVEDLLWRRSKLGLHRDQIDMGALENYLTQHHQTGLDAIEAVA